MTQDVFLKVYRNLASFDGSKGSFQTWITTLARNLLVDNYRRNKLDRATDSMDISLSSDEDGPTLSERLADTRPNQEQRFRGAGAEGDHPAGAGQAFAGAAGGGDSAGPGGYGL